MHRREQHDHLLKQAVWCQEAPAGRPELWSIKCDSREGRMGRAAGPSATGCSLPCTQCFSRRDSQNAGATNMVYRKWPQTSEVGKYCVCMYTHTHTHTHT